MDPSQIPPELIVNGADHLQQATQGFLRRILGPWADEVGDAFGDNARIFRYKRAVRLLEEVREWTQQKGIEPKAVPIKTLLPILENASIEEDESLFERWKALLASAVSGAYDVKEHSDFPYILSRIGPLDAIVLKSVSDSVGGVEDISTKSNIDVAKIRSSMDRLLSLGLLSGVNNHSGLGISEHKLVKGIDQLSTLGQAFIKVVESE